MRNAVVVFVAVLSSLVGTNYLADESGRYLFPTLAPEIEEQLDSRRAARLRRLSAAAYGERWGELARIAEALGEELARARHQDSRTFAVVAAYRSLAAAALGEEADAVWHWHVAVNLLPDIDYAELKRMFEISPALLKAGLPSYRGVSGVPTGEAQEVAAESSPPSIDHGSMVRLNFLLAPSLNAPPFTFSADLIIGVEGRLHSPRVLTSARERGAESYSALEALRRWRYTPAMVNGEPAEALTQISQRVGTPPAGARRF